MNNPTTHELAAAREMFESSDSVTSESKIHFYASIIAKHRSEELQELQRKAKALDDLRVLMGYTSHACEQVITLFEDDATNTLFMKVGDNECYFGSNLLEAIESAMKESNE